MDSIGNFDPASDYDETEQYLMFGGYIVERMTFCIMNSRLRSFFVTASALKSRRTPRLGFRNVGLGVEGFFVLGLALSFSVFSAEKLILCFFCKFLCEPSTYRSVSE